jgi:hypothetical protein
MISSFSPWFSIHAGGLEPHLRIRLTIPLVETSL